MALLDADDVWEPTKLAQLAELITTRPTLSVAFSNFSMFRADGVIDGWQGNLLAQLTEYGLDPIQVSSTRYLFQRNVSDELIRRTSFMHPSTVVIKRKVLEEVGLFDESYRNAEDLECWIRV